MKKHSRKIIIVMLFGLFFMTACPEKKYPVAPEPTPVLTLTEATGTAQFSPRAGHTSVVYNNEMWVIGGTSNGTSGLNDIWYSMDGANWLTTTAGAGFTGRWGHTSVVYNNAMWVIEGYNGSTYYSDIWSSSDGANWTGYTITAAFSARAYHTSLVYNNEMWVIGGAYN